MKAVLKAFALLVAIVAILTVATFIWIGSRGVSARAQPGRVETAMARTIRGLAIPRSARALKNPVARSAEIVAEGMAHYADHCAACHANDGSGETELGLGLYPKPPDMRLPATQSLSDGELFYIIENGIRFTGMPAWSTGREGDSHSTWHLVHFIRELPRLTPDQVNQMKTLNPRSPDEIREEVEKDNAAKDGPQPAKPRTPPHTHIHKR